MNKRFAVMISLSLASVAILAVCIAWLGSSCLNSFSHSGGRRVDAYDSTKQKPRMIDDLTFRYRREAVDGLTTSGEWLRTYPDTRLAAAIAEFDATALPVLHDILKGSDDLRAWDAAYTLGMIGSEQSVKPLIDGYHKHVSRRKAAVWARMAICRALGKIGSLQSVAFLDEVRRSAPAFRDSYHEGTPGRFLLRHVAARALEEVNGEPVAYAGKEAYEPPPSRDQVPFAAGHGQLTEWEIDGGTWRPSEDGIQGTADGTARLWLKRDVPGTYTFSFSLESRDGEAGVSFGHLKDYIALAAEYGPKSRRCELQVSPGLVNLRGLSATWRSCEVTSAADLQGRLALFVRDGSASFTDIKLEEEAVALSGTDWYDLTLQEANIRWTIAPVANK